MNNKENVLHAGGWVDKKYCGIKAQGIVEESNNKD